MNLAKSLRNADELAHRLSMISERHIAPLTAFVHDLRARKGPIASIPYFDPMDGGIEAEALFLLEAPGPRARNSGFVSMNNPDETAKNVFEISREAGIDRKRIVLWNTVPWYIGSETRIRPANRLDINEGIESLGTLLGLLPNLHAIVLVGGKAQRAEAHVRTIAPNLRLFMSPHPSPMFVNRRPGNRNDLLESWKAIGRYLAEAHSNGDTATERPASRQAGVTRSLTHD